MVASTFRAFFIAAVCSFLSSTTFAALRYVRSDATGNNSGSDWTNAYPSLPNPLNRGDIYYVADGTYPSYTFNATAGTTLIIIKKAVEADHGTATGWQTAFGNGVALFNGGISFNTSYIEFDGVTGGGPGAWTTGHGFEIISTGAQMRDNGEFVHIGDGVSNVSVKHVNMHALNQDFPMSGIKGTAGASNLFFSSNAIHTTYGPAFHIGTWSDTTIERCYIARVKSRPEWHAEAVSSIGTNTNLTFRHNIFDEIEGTAVFAGVNYGSSVNWKIYGNIFTRSVTTIAYYEEAGGTNHQTMTGLEFHNNVVVNGGASQGTMMIQSGSNNKAFNNIWYNNDANSFGFSSNVQRSHNYFSDNQRTEGCSPACDKDAEGASGDANAQIATGSPFVNATADPLLGDYRLKAATNNGTALASPYNSDAFSKTRGSDGTWDRGAYEFGGTTPPPLPQPEVYVAVTGNDTTCARGDAARPCASFSRAYTLAVAGDVIKVGGGTYGDQVLPSIAKGVTKVIVQPLSPSAPVILGSLNIRASYVDVYNMRANDGVDISNGLTRGIPADTHHVTIVNVNGKSLGIVAEDVLVSGGDFGGFDACLDSSGEDIVQIWELQGNDNVWRASNRVVIDGITVHDITDRNNECAGTAHAGWHVDGLQILSGHNITIRNSRFYNNATSNVMIRPFRAGMGNIVLENNFFAPVLHPGASVNIGDDLDDITGTNVMRYNTIQGGVAVECAGTNCFEVYGNIMDTGSCFPTVKYSYNVFPTGSAMCGTNAKRGDPALIGPTPNPTFLGGVAPNYHLTNTDTAAVGAGDPTRFPSTDIDDQSRPLGGAPDAGADEIVGPVASGPKIYYIDFVSGLDSNNGTSKTTPWKRAPGMTGFAGTYSHFAGDRFIFKGGVTWDNTALPLTINANGAAGAVDYYGVDATWFIGSSWTRPIFDGEYVEGTLISLGSRQNVTIDGLELKRVSSSGSTGYGLITGDGASHHIVMNNIYGHGWRTTNSFDDAHGGIIFTGSPGAQIETIELTNSEIENAENIGQASWGRSNGLAVRFVGRIYKTVIHDVSSAVLFTIDYDGNTMYNVSHVDENTPGPNSPSDIYHSNGVYLDCQTLGKTTCWIRNSVFHDIAGGSNMSYLNGRNSTIYNYNNVYYGSISDQRAIEIEPYDYGGNRTSGTYHIYNNTGFLENGTPLVHIVNRSGVPQPSSVILRNNHVIGTSVSLDDNGPAAGYTRSNNLVQTAAVATAQGYTQSTLWTPTIGSGGTVGTGFDASSVFTTDRLGMARSAPWDIGAYEFGGTSNPPGDTTAPTVTITGPGANASVQGTVTISATATDAVGVTSVQFQIDGTNLGAADTTSPYSRSWNTTTFSNGAHTISVVASDAAGNITTATRDVTVSNVTSDTTPPVISNISESNITATGARISLTTDETSQVRVTWWVDPIYTYQSSLGAALTNHNIDLTGLFSGSIIHYRVEATNLAGLSTTSPDRTFTTPTSAPGEEPAQISYGTGFGKFKNIFYPAKGEQLEVTYTVEGEVSAMMSASALYGGGSDSNNVHIAVYSRQGEVIKVLENSTRSAGSHSVIWDGRNESGERVAAGAYVLKMQKGDKVHKKKVVVLK